MRKFFQFSHSEVVSLFQSGESIFRDRFFVLLRQPRKYNYARLLVITPKKIGSAPLRNTVRRRIKAIFYEQELSELLTFDYALIVRTATLRLSFSQVTDMLNKIFLKQKE